jgi:hypothetical protein
MKFLLLLNIVAVVAVLQQVSMKIQHHTHQSPLPYSLLSQLNKVLTSIIIRSPSSFQSHFLTTI